MKTHLLFGHTRLSIDLPPTAEALEPRPLPGLTDPVPAIRQALAQPIHSPPLHDVARGKKSACLVVSDITRPVPNRILLPPLLEILIESGLPLARITILIATGMHRPNLGSELLALLGPEILGQVPVFNHMCRQGRALRRVGDLDGAPLEINRHYLDAELKILTGLIEPHFYAGFSGGAKAILPGISSLATMKKMHSFAMIEHARVTNCLLQGNPFYEAGLRAASLAGVDFLVNVVINQQRELAGVFAGQYQQAHRTGCALVARHALRRLDGPVDLVVTSGGGYPLDATFYQTSKALVCAKDILRPGGAIVVASECREGLGSHDFSRILRQTDGPHDFFFRYRDPDHFVMDQWCAQSIYQVLAYAGEVHVFSPGLRRDDLQPSGAHLIDNLQRTIEALLPTHPRVAVMPEGPYVVGQIAANYPP